MRYREQYDPKPVTLQFWAKGSTCSQTSWTLLSTSSAEKLGEFKSMSDVVTRDFARRKARGDIIMNPMHKVRCVIASSGTGFAISSKALSCPSPALYHDYRIEGDWLAWMFSSAPRDLYVSNVVEVDEMDALLTEVSTAMENRRGRQPSNLWETVAEAHQTRSLLPSLGRSALGVVTRLGVKRFQSAADFYLAARYGLLPIISDTENVLKQLEKTVGKVRNKVKTENALVKTSQETLWYSHNFVKTKLSIETMHRFYAKAISIDEVDFSTLERIGFSFKGLATLPWELTTLSFVADWFVNIGDYLGAITPALGWNQLGKTLCVTDDRICTVSSLGTFEDTGTYRVTSPVGGSVILQRTAEWRQAPRPPGITVRPKFDLFDGSTRDADAFALAGQRLARLVTRRK